jgi:hypothetical protein
MTQKSTRKHAVVYRPWRRSFEPQRLACGAIDAAVESADAAASSTSGRTTGIVACRSPTPRLSRAGWRAARVAISQAATETRTRARRAATLFSSKALAAWGLKKSGVTTSASSQPASTTRAAPGPTPLAMAGIIGRAGGGRQAGALRSRSPRRDASLDISGGKRLA